MTLTAATVVEAVALVLICATSLLGNIGLFIIVTRKRPLRTITNGFLLNLALADLLVSALNMPVTVVTIIQQRWIFGQAACVLFGFTTIVSFISSVLSLGMIAINRYYFVVRWKTYFTIFTRRRSISLACTVWLISILLSVPPLFGWSEYRFIPGKSYCFVFWPSDVYYMYFMLLICFFGPLAVMGVSYFNILTFTRKIRQRVKQHGRENLRDTRSNEEQNNVVDSRGTNRFLITPESKITNTFLIIVACFIGCWAPFAVTMFIDVYWSRPLPRVIDIGSLLLGYLNSMCNPIVYGVRNQVFRREFINLFRKCLPCLINRRVFSVERAIVRCEVGTSMARGPEMEVLEVARLWRTSENATRLTPVDVECT